MGLINCLPQEAKIISAIKPQAGGAIAGTYVSLKKYNRAFVFVYVNQANAATMAITIEQAQAVANTGSKAITVAVPIWVNADCDTTPADALVRQTDAVAYTTSAATTTKLVVFQIDPATLDLAGGFNCITVKTGASNAANITAAFYVLTTPEYQGATPPSAVVD